MLKLSCRVSCLVSRELNYFQYGSWNTGTVVLNRFHKGCICTMPLSTTQSESTRQKFLKNYCSLIYLKKKKNSLSSYYLRTFWPKALLPGFIGPGVREQSEPWEIHAYSTRLQWNILERRGLSPFTPSPSSFPHPKLDPRLIPRKGWQSRNAKKNKRIPHFRVPRRCPII